MKVEFIELKKSKKPYKYVVRLRIDDKEKTVRFGAAGYSDYTKHGDKERKDRYLARHKVRENWTRSGVGTRGWWSRWLLWNKTTIQGSLEDTLRRFRIRRGVSPPSKTPPS